MHDIDFTDPSVRLEYIYRQSLCRTWSEFSRKLGYPRSENLSQVKKGNNRISISLGERIKQHYPQLSFEWILTGRGLINDDVDKRAVKEKLNCIPFWENTQSTILPQRYYYLPLVDSADYEFCHVYDEEDMFPRLKPGSLIFMKRAEGYFRDGKMYFVPSDKCHFIRLARVQERGRIEFKSTQPLKFPDIIMNDFDIKLKYLVCGCLTFDNV